MFYYQGARKEGWFRFLEFKEILSRFIGTGKQIIRFYILTDRKK